FPPIGAVVGNCDLPLDQIRGESRYAGRWLHVSPGLGHSIYAPFRFACRPEATLVEVR
ncbi:MAG: metallophosphoesterase, partial [Actinomycetota bacterium]